MPLVYDPSGIGNGKEGDKGKCKRNNKNKNPFKIKITLNKHSVTFV